jgi:hypothetical protein
MWLLALPWRFLKWMCVGYWKWITESEKYVEQNLTGDFFWALSTNTIESFWDMLLPQQQEMLRRYFRQVLPRWVITYDFHLPTIIENARKCDIEIPGDEEVALCLEALERTQKLDTKWTLANALYGPHFPTAVVYDMLQMAIAEGRKIDYILDRLDPRDRSEIFDCIEFVAGLGDYAALRKTAKFFDEKPLKRFVRLCLRRAVKLPQPRLPEIVKMCIRVRDWRIGDRIFLKLLESDMIEHAKDLTFRMYLDGRSNAAAA